MDKSFSLHLYNIPACNLISQVYSGFLVKLEPHNVHYL